METLRVLVSDKLSPKGIEVFKAAGPRIAVDVKTGLKPEELEAIIGDYHALAVRSATSVNARIINAGKNLRVIGRAGIGVDNVDVEAASRRGIVVMNTPEGNVVTTAEHAIALMMALARQIPQATASMKGGKWEKSKFSGREITNKTLGIVGLGNIGKIVADRAQGLRMKVVAYDPFVTQERAHELGVELVTLDQLLERSDFVTLHVPLIEATKGLIDAKALGKMKKGAFLIDAARGGLVDEAAVAEAVKSGKLGGAAFDVFAKEPVEKDNPLLAVENVILTPHLGASTDEAQENVSIAVAEQIIAFLSAGAVRNAVNAPSVSAELMASVGPYMKLGRRIGVLAGQLHKGGVRKLRMAFRGNASELPTAPIAMQMLSGLLCSRLGPDVNDVNAPLVAKDRGIEWIEEKGATARDFAASIGLRVEGDDGATDIVGALFGSSEPRIVRVNGNHLDIVPEGHILLTRHHDKPGIIGKVGTLLGSKNVNISRLVLANSREHDGTAMAAFSVDAAPPEDTVRAMTALDGIVEAQHVDLS